jgi:hypothetical protein
MLHITGINAAGDNTFASFALFADNKNLCVLRASAVNDINLPVTYVGAALRLRSAQDLAANNS